MNTIFASVESFVWNPLLACLPAAIFGIIAFQLYAVRKQIGHRIFIIVCTAFGAWVLFTLNELAAKVNESNIRADLLFMWPPLLLLSFVASCAGIYGLIQKFRLKKIANHGLESTGAPPAAGTPETHP